MDDKLALTIVNEFNSNVPKDQRIEYNSYEDLHELAEGVVHDAVEAWREGMRGETVKTILELSKSGDQPNKDVTPFEERKKAEARIAKEKLPIPPELEGEPTQLPRDISALSNVHLRRYHGEFYAYLARANWLVAIEESDEYAADQIARHYKAMVLRDLVANAPKDTKITALEAEASQDGRVRKWIKLKNEHYVQVKLLKALRDTYEDSCDRMSREYTMRQSETK